ncbi:OmpA family protein [Nocardiopsis protaetiae]|uniref:OmpA family protein n=1 Tax=Nocardiopsis protaetiae TaxID=3382270 RepID=UPI00387ADA15
MPRSPWSITGEALATVFLLVGPPLLASFLGWPPQRTEMSWTWLMQYLRGGTIPSAAVITAAVVALWAMWAAHLVLVALDVVAVLRGLVPRVGLIRLVWVLSAGGATAATTTTASWADTTTLVAGEEVSPQDTVTEQGGERSGDELISRVRTLSHFGFDSVELTPQMRESLAATVEMISEHGDSGTPVVVTGHTDPVGDPFYNRDLSERRAQAVADHLKEQTGRDDVRFEVQGLGEDRPPEEEGVSYERYRRVEIAYTLRPAPEPASVPPAEAEEQRSAAEEQDETVQVEVVASGETANAPHPVLVGAVAGAAGLGVGYAAGRHRGTLRHRRSPGRTDEETETVPSADEAPPADPDDDLVRRDPEGVAREVVDTDGFVLVAEKTRVRGRQGIGCTGPHAEAALRAMIADHIPGPVIATESALTALGGPGSAPIGVRRVEGAHEALIEVDILMLHAAREGVSGEGSAEVAGDRRTPLVVCTDQDFTAGEVPGPAGSSGEVMCVLGGRGVGVVLEFQGPDRVSMTAPVHREVCDRPRLSDWDAPSDQEPAQELAQGTAEADIPPDDTTQTADGAVLPRPVEEPERTSPGRLQVRLLSPQLVCEVDGQAVQGLRSSSLTLLAVLALKGGVKGTPVSDQELLGCLAPDTDVERARRLRSNAVTSLRKTVREVLDLGSEAPVVEKEGGFYRLQDGLFDVDVHRFWRLHKKSSGQDEETSAQALKEAIGLYKSDLLSDSDEAWVGRQRRRIQVEFSDACTRLIKETPNAEEKVSLIELALRIDPMNEVLHREKMTQYSQLGRKEMVHRAFREMKETLSHFGARPDATSQELFRNLTG